MYDKVSQQYTHWSPCAQIWTTKGFGFELLLSHFGIEFKKFKFGASRGWRSGIDSTLTMEDIQKMLKGLRNMSFSFVNRNVNHVAHFFAHFGKTAHTEFLWLDDVPEDCRSQ